MQVYHSTTREFAECISEEGFPDVTAGPLTRAPGSGVWVTERPIMSGDGLGRIDAWFEISIDEPLLEPFEWAEKGSAFRQWVVPADMLNEHGLVRHLDETDAMVLYDAWLDRYRSRMQDTEQG
jgi:hypothetical protein